MKRYQLITGMFALFILSGSVSAVNPLLILSGVDTLLISKIPGFDFIEQKACTSFSDYPGCHNHFYFQFFQEAQMHYDIRVEYGYAVKMGKMNLDSLTSAPHDTIFQKSPGRADAIPPDSLSSRIGYCYWIKTGVDPRPAFSGTFFAKIKILNFKVIDSAQHKVEMVFLWAFQFSHGRDLRTSGLDTFHLDNPPVFVRSGQSHPAFSIPDQRVYKVVGERFIVPAGTISTGAFLSVYDLAGKRLGSAVVGKDGVVDLRTVRRGVRGVVMVRAIAKPHIINFK